MLRKKQVVLNLMVIVALLVSVTGVLPVGARVAPDVSEQAAAVTSLTQANDKSAAEAGRQPDQLKRPLT